MILKNCYILEDIIINSNSSPIERKVDAILFSVRNLFNFLALCNLKLQKKSNISENKILQAMRKYM